MLQAVNKLRIELSRAKAPEEVSDALENFAADLDMVISKITALADSVCDQTTDFRASFDAGNAGDIDDFVTLRRSEVEDFIDDIYPY